MRCYFRTFFFINNHKMFLFLGYSIPVGHYSQNSYPLLPFESVETGGRSLQHDRSVISQDEFFETSGWVNIFFLICLQGSYLLRFLLSLLNIAKSPAKLWTPEWNRNKTNTTYCCQHEHAFVTSFPWVFLCTPFFNQVHFSLLYIPKTISSPQIQ